MRSLIELVLYAVAGLVGASALSGCVSSSELRELAQEVSQADADIAQLFTQTADLIDEKTAVTMTGLGQAAEGGLLGLLGAAAGAYGMAKRKKKSTPL